MLLWLYVLLPLTLGGEFTADKVEMPGRFPLYLQEKTGKVFLKINEFDQSFLYINGLATGLGSNDIGLDRGQLGGTRVVRFHRVGSRVLMLQDNSTFIAESENPDEVNAVAESFADTVVWGTDIVAEEDGGVFVDLHGLLFQDRHGVIQRLADLEEGNFTLDPARSYLYLPRVKAFPHNTELEVALTFQGRAADGGQVERTVADPSAITLRQHHSFVKLPEPGYQRRVFHPRSGGFEFSVRDYAAPLDQSLDKRFVVRHRLEKKDPQAEKSEAVEPLIYYVDRGAPAQIRDALIEGASWWNQAFEAAGFKNAFRVEVLPEGADPMDVRYNVIQWVHRSTRGWSYGASVVDPRTGEIIKGHVTLGSLRVRQDRLLFEGMIPHGCESTDVDPVNLALDRIKQLSAHEVGHTLGLAHNFAASARDRASVMDYPAPLVLLKDGKLDFSQVYDLGIGRWDIQAIRYLYQPFADESAGLRSVLAENRALDLPYITDQDSRSVADMHPLASLWDNGADALDEFERVVQLRRYLLDRFNECNLDPESPRSSLEEVFVPLYLHHRFQLQALGKSLGGVSFSYGENGEPNDLKTVAGERQKRVLDWLTTTLTPEFLAVPEFVRENLPPRAYGYTAHRELFDRRTGGAFDLLSPVDASVDLTLDVFLEPGRANRLLQQHALDDAVPGWDTVLDHLFSTFQSPKTYPGYLGLVHRQVGVKVAERLQTFMKNGQVRPEIRALTAARLQSAADSLAKSTKKDAYGPYHQYLAELLKSASKTQAEKAEPGKIPPGSPIGQ